jgi:X-X-X-Leu-X-X-Gly heptad repeat protein
MKIEHIVSEADLAKTFQQNFDQARSGANTLPSGANQSISSLSRSSGSASGPDSLAGIDVKILRDGCMRIKNGQQLDKSHVAQFSKLYNNL